MIWEFFPNSWKFVQFVSKKGFNCIVPAKEKEQPANAVGLWLGAVRRTLCFLLCCWCVISTHCAAIAREFPTSVIAQYGDSSLRLDTISLTNSSGQKFSVSRLDFLLSGLALQQESGDWIQNTNWFAFISFAEQRTNLTLQLPPGNFEKIRLNVGVPPEINHGDPAQYPAHHPLNANLNGLHWTWANGYIFFAMEGHWLNNDGQRSGYSYHLGNDWMLTPLEFSFPKSLGENAVLELAVDVSGLFEFTFTEENSSTHSRQGDDFATALREKLKDAFSIKVRVTSAKNPLATAINQQTREAVPLPFTGTPYRFTFPAEIPIPNLPKDNPLTVEGVELGRTLFFDQQLSINNSQSCASCHVPGAAFSDPNRFSIGAEGKQGTRHSMPLFNLAWKKSFFWDGRSPTLREQVLEPIQNPAEMNETLTNLTAKLMRLSTKENGTNYPALFERAFGGPEITSDRIAKALEQFLLTQLSFDSKFDRAMAGETELSDEEKRGFQLFMTEYDPRREQFGADCFHCHGGPFFTTHHFANNGLDSIFSDNGRSMVTKKESDHGKFSVPSLRNVERTAPYMHDGRFATLEEVIEHYSGPATRSPTLDPNIAKHPSRGINLSSADKKALMAFLTTLTDSKFTKSSE